MRYSRTGQKWSFREEELLRRLFFQGKSVNVISQELRREQDAIVHRLISAGLIGFADYPDVPAKHNTPWTDSELSQLEKEYKSNLDIDTIAKNHQRQRNSILHNLVKLRLIDISDRGIIDQFKDNSVSNISNAEMNHSQDDDIENNFGGSKMGFKHVSHAPKKVNENPTIVGGFSGRNDAVFLKNKYQEELDKTWDAIINMVHYLETKNSELKEIYSKVPGIKKNIEAHQKERVELYTNLSNVLTKETDFEDKMWKTTQVGRKVKSITVKQKFKDSDVDEMRYDSMLEYLKQYPEYASKSTFKKILEKIEQKESEIRRETEKYNNLISEYNFRLNNFEKDIKKAEDKFDAYGRIKKEAEEKLKSARYNKSILNRFRSEQAKSEANLDLLHHRVDQFENTLSIIKSEHSQNKRKMFVDLEH